MTAILAIIISLSATANVVISQLTFEQGSNANKWMPHYASGIQYMYVPDCLNWDRAQKYCLALDTELASAHLEEQRTFLVTTVIDSAPTSSGCTSWPERGSGTDSYGIWMGGTHNGTSSTSFAQTAVNWFDGSSTPFSQIDWDQDEPNNYDGHKGIAIHYPNLKFHTSYLGDSGCALICQKEIPVTPAPETKPPTTQTPTTKAPTTQTPTTKVPTTNSPTTKVPTTKVPTTRAPTTRVPTTQMPTTQPPTTNNPTENPTTRNPTEHPIEAPTTNYPTENPTTRNPTEHPTEAPITSNPTANPTETTSASTTATASTTNTITTTTSTVSTDSATQSTPHTTIVSVDSTTQSTPQTSTESTTTNAPLTTSSETSPSESTEPITTSTAFTSTSSSTSATVLTQSTAQISTTSLADASVDISWISTHIESKTTKTDVSSIKMTHILSSADVQTIVIFVLLAVIISMCILLCVKEKRRKMRVSQRSSRNNSTNSTASPRSTQEKDRPTEWTQNAMRVPKLLPSNNSLSSSLKKMALKISNSQSPELIGILNENQHGTIPPGALFHLNMNESVLQPQEPKLSIHVVPGDRIRETFHAGENSDAVSELALSELSKMEMAQASHRKRHTNLGAEGILGKMVDAGSKSNLSADAGSSNSSFRQVGFKQVTDASSQSNLSITHGKHPQKSINSSSSNLSEGTPRNKKSNRSELSVLRQMTEDSSDSDSDKSRDKTQKNLVQNTKGHWRKNKNVHNLHQNKAAAKHRATDSNYTVIITNEDEKNVNQMGIKSIDFNSPLNVIEQEEKQSVTKHGLSGMNRHNVALPAGNYSTSSGSQTRNFAINQGNYPQKQIEPMNRHNAALPEANYPTNNGLATRNYPAHNGNYQGNYGSNIADNNMHHPNPLAMMVNMQTQGIYGRHRGASRDALLSMSREKTKQ